MARRISVYGVVVLGLVVTYVVASIGDRLPEFRQCVRSCIADCSSKPKLPFYLELLLWDCSQDCDYQCQRYITDKRIERGVEIVQFHGKWPFVRVLGIQEPMSVLFSMLNFIPHFKGFLKLYRYKDFPDSHLRDYYLVFSAIGMNAWVWSSVFHTRDFLVTERLDYFSAMLTILYGLFAATVRIFRLDLESRKHQRYILMVVCTIAYACHVGYLSLITFSYSYNMAAGVVVGLIQNALWTYFAFSSYSKLQQESPNTANNWTLWPFYIVISVTLGMAFELFDFPPFLFLLDAHALWHAATVLPTYWWYVWMEKDLQYLRTCKSRE